VSTEAGGPVGTSVPGVTIGVMPQVKQITSPPPEDTGGADTDEDGYT
jgi:hypothetical protein